MSIDHTARIEGVVKAALKTVSLGTPCGYAVSMGTVPIADKQGSISNIGPGWTVLVSIPHPRPAIGRGRQEISSSFPVPGNLPPDAAFEQVVKNLWENCQQAAEETKNEKPSAIGMKLG